MTGWRARLADWFERQVDHEFGKAIVDSLAERPRMAVFHHRQGLAAERIGRALRGQNSEPDAGGSTAGDSQRGS